MHAPQESIPAALDRQIGSEQDVAFGHRHFAQALRSLVESDHHQPLQLSLPRHATCLHAR